LQKLYLSITLENIITCTMPASAGISCCHVSVCPSVTSHCSTEMAKHRITQRRWQMQVGSSLNAGAVAANWQLSM